MDLVTKIEQWI